MESGDPDHGADARAGCHRTGGWTQGDRFLGKRFEVDCLTNSVGLVQTGSCKGDEDIKQIVDTFTAGTLLGVDGGGNPCNLAHSNGTLSTNDGDTLTYGESGTLCQSTGFSARNGGFVITGGTKRFKGANGTGTFTVGSTGAGFRFHIDGNIQLPQQSDQE